MEKIRNILLHSDTKGKKKTIPLISLKGEFAKTKLTIPKPVDKEYSNEELEMVQQIISYKDFYKILGIKTTANNLEIKKAYRNLALKVHPDKNKAPGAVDAFKKVNNAANVLSNAQERLTYDFGRNQRNFEERSIHYNKRGLSLSASNINNIIRTFYNTSPLRRRNHFNLILLMNGIVMDKRPQIKNLYSLIRTEKYAVRKITKNYQVRYFVGLNFHVKHHKYIDEIEKAIEDKFILDFFKLPNGNKNKKHIFC